jgi:hypothetical protein
LVEESWRRRRRRVIVRVGGLVLLAGEGDVWMCGCVLEVKCLVHA